MNHPLLNRITATKRQPATAALPGDAALVFEILSDYAGYSEWLPALKASRVLARENNFAVVEFAPGARPDPPLNFECMHAPNATVVLHTLEGSDPALRLEFRISPTDTGGCSVTVTTAMSGSLSRFYGALMSPETILEGLRGAVLAVAGEIPLGPGEEKIFELLETDEGLVCWYRGTKYFLKEAGR
jgi:hypothetical protein